MRNHLKLSRRRLAVLAISVFLLVPAAVFAAAQSQSIAGHWEGSLQVPGNPIAFSIDFSQKSDGGLAASISIPAQGARDLPVGNISVTGSDVAFELLGVPGSPKFKGKVEDGGARIAGTLTQGGGTIPFSLERKQAPAAAAKEALAGFDDICT